MTRHDGFAFIGLTLIAFCVAIFYVAREGMTANSIIYLVGAGASVLIALVAMRGNAPADIWWDHDFAGDAGGGGGGAALSLGFSSRRCIRSGG